MPVIRDIPLSLKTREVLRRQGFRGQSKVRSEIKSLILELLASIKKAHLLEPAIAYKIYTITEMNQMQLSLESNLVVHGPLLPSLLPEAKELAVVVGTIGPGWKNRQQTTSSGTSRCEVCFWMALAAPPWTQ